nr:retrovirus-related Pol polyprotein from transposon TNT 1-94 [Tanacetum cinerariifolium]
MKFCTNLQTRILDLEKTKTTQALEIDSLKRRVKKLEKKKKSRTQKLKRLYNVGLTAKVDSSKDEPSLGEDASKPGRKIDNIDQDEDITLVNAAGEINAASIATTDSAATTITTEEIKLAQTLVEIKTTKPKSTILGDLTVKGIALIATSSSSGMIFINSSWEQTFNHVLREYRRTVDSGGGLHQGTLDRSAVDPTLFTRKARNDLLLVQIYVDDIIFASTNTAICDEFAKLMTTKFKMSMMGKMTFFLGLQISQSPRGIFINQSKYASGIVKKYGMLSSDSIDTPLVENSKLDDDLQGKPVDAKIYHGMIGSLMYLTSSRPDLTYAVCLCARLCNIDEWRSGNHGYRVIIRGYGGGGDMVVCHRLKGCLDH